MLVTVRGKTVKLPDFFVVGAAKSGSSSLYYFLIQHPQILMPTIKEPRFFGFMEHPPQYSVPGHREDKTIIWRFEDYVKLFENAREGQRIGEGSVGYLYTYKITIEHIESIYGEKCKNLKIIAVLRNPVDRAFSQYLSHIRGGVEKLSFEEAVDPEVIKSRIHKARGYDYIGFGMYYNQVRAYLEAFPNMRIYLSEDLKNTRILSKDLFKFLDVDCNIEIDISTKANPSGIPKNRFLVNLLLNSKINSIRSILPMKYRVKLASFRDNLLKILLKKPVMDTVTRKKLINIFRNDILSLQKLINRDLSHWLEVEN